MAEDKNKGGAPLGNQNALGNEGGRPLIFSTPEEMQEKITGYFEQFPIGTRTITGLALFLGFESRQSFYDYEDRVEFSYMIKRARLEVEASYEMCLYGKNTSGPIFALKNMGWADNIKTDHTTNGKEITGFQITDLDGSNL